ncbi:MAG: hypothetical protein GY771_13275 [bacterium]|nr:hypothetical protein [bacterium]
MKYLKLGIVVFVVFVLVGVLFGCNKRGADESELKTTETAPLITRPAGTEAPEPENGEQNYAYKDFYLGMPESEFMTTFGSSAANEGNGVYIYRGYPDREVKLAFSDLLGGRYLTSIAVKFLEWKDDEVLIEELNAVYGEPEYDSIWVPPNTDCNDLNKPHRSVLWQAKVEINLSLSASRDFDESNKEGVTFSGELSITDNPSWREPNEWIKKKINGEL